MTETRDELLARIRRGLVEELGLMEWRIPEGWNYKLGGKVVAFVGKKRALGQVSAKLSVDEAEKVLQRVDVEPHPVGRLASAGWVTINVYEETQLPFVFHAVRTSIEQTGAKRPRAIRDA